MNRDDGSYQLSHVWEQSLTDVIKQKSDQRSKRR